MILFASQIDRASIVGWRVVDAFFQFNHMIITVATVDANNKDVFTVSGKSNPTQDLVLRLCNGGSEDFGTLTIPAADLPSIMAGNSTESNSVHPSFNTYVGHVEASISAVAVLT